MTIRDIQNQGSRFYGTMRSAIRSATLIGYPELARSVGLDAHRLMRKCGLDPSCLSDPDARIDAAAVTKLLATSAADCLDDSLMAGERLPLRHRRVRVPQVS
jgi:Arabinose-binding domain of AraC transcription regulator, N-term